MGEPLTCGTCGRETLPDGDCYGCEVDRCYTRIATLKEAIREVLDPQHKDDEDWCARCKAWVTVERGRCNYVSCSTCKAEIGSCSIELHDEWVLGRALAWKEESDG